jgi:hypothetical protein
MFGDSTNFTQSGILLEYMTRWMSFRSAALASLLVLIPAAARADVTITLTSQSFDGWTFMEAIDYTQFNLTGSLTGVTIDASLDVDALSFTYAKDISVLLDKKTPTPLTLDSSNPTGLRQIGGGVGNLSLNFLPWPNDTGDGFVATTKVTGTVDLSGAVSPTSAILFTGDEAADGKLWIGNSSEPFSFLGPATGIWTGTIQLLGVTAIPISGTPVPEASTWSAAGLLVLGSWWTNRRRNSR